MRKELMGILVFMAIAMFCVPGVYAQGATPVVTEVTEEIIIEQKETMTQEMPAEEMEEDTAEQMMMPEEMEEETECRTESIMQGEPMMHGKTVQEAMPVCPKSQPKDIREEMANMASQLDAMEEKADALSKLGKKKGADETELKTAYEEYVTEIKNTKAQAETLSKTSRHIRSRGELYFADWLQELESIKKSVLRKKGMKNRDKEEKTFSQFADETNKTDEALQSLIDNLKDVKRYLEFDLTSKNISSVSTELRGTSTDVKKIKRGIDMMKKKLDSLTSFSNIIERK